MYLRALLVACVVLVAVQESYAAVLPAQITDQQAGCIVRKQVHAVNSSWNTPNGKKRCRCAEGGRVECEKTDATAVDMEKDSCKVPTRRLKLLRAVSDKKGSFNKGEEITLTCKRGHSPVNPAQRSIKLVCDDKNLTGKLNKSGFSCRRAKRGRSGSVFCEVPKDLIETANAKLVHPKKRSMRGPGRGSMSTFKIPLGQKLIVKCKPGFKPANETVKKFVAKCQKGGKLNKSMAEFSCIANPE